MKKWLRKTIRFRVRRRRALARASGSSGGVARFLCKPRVTATDGLAETPAKRARMPHKLLMRCLWRLLSAAARGGTTGQGDFTVHGKLRFLNSWQELQDYCTETRIMLDYESPLNTCSKRWRA